jgi:hypothetical protein
MAKDRVDIIYTLKDRASKVGAKLSGTLKKLGTTAKFAAIAGIGALALGIRKSLKLWGVQEQAVKSLNTALQNTGNFSEKTSKSLQNYAASLQKVTTFGDEEIIKAQSIFAQYGMNAEQIKKLTKVTLDMAVAKGMKLSAAADLVSKSVGSSTNALTRYGVTVEGAVGSTERVNMAAENMSKLFGGQAEAAAQTLSGSMTQLSNAVGDVFELVGKGMSNALGEMTRGITSFVQSEQMTAFFTKVGEKIGDVISGISRFFSRLQQTGALKSFYNAMKSVWGIAGDLWGILSRTGVVDAIIDAFKLLAGALEIVFTNIQKITNGINEFLKQQRGTQTERLTRQLETENRAYRNRINLLARAKERLAKFQETEGKGMSRQYYEQELEKQKKYIDGLEAQQKKYLEKTSKELTEKIKKEQEKTRKAAANNAVETTTTNTETNILDNDKDDGDTETPEQRAARISGEALKERMQNWELWRDYLETQRDVSLEEEKTALERMLEDERIVGEERIALKRKYYGVLRDLRKADVKSEENTLATMLGLNETQYNQLTALAGIAGVKQAEISKAEALYSIGVKTWEAAQVAAAAAPWPTNIPLVAGAIAQGAANAAAVQGIEFALAEGGSMIVDRPTRIGQNVLAGEAGAERIDVTPLDQGGTPSVNVQVMLDGKDVAKKVYVNTKQLQKKGTLQS